MDHSHWSKYWVSRSWLIKSRVIGWGGPTDLFPRAVRRELSILYFISHVWDQKLEQIHMRRFTWRESHRENHEWNLFTKVERSGLVCCDPSFISQCHDTVSITRTLEGSRMFWPECHRWSWREIRSVRDHYRTIHEVGTRTIDPIKVLAMNHVGAGSLTPISENNQDKMVQGANRNHLAW
jgi:hypothetical protein